MKKLLIALIVVSAAFILNACGKDNKNSNPIVGSCPAGYTWNGSVCVDQFGTGVDMTTARFGISNCNGYSCGDVSEFRVTNANVYQDFLEKGLGVCQNQNAGGNNHLDCKNWWPGKYEISLTATNWNNPGQYCYNSTGLSISPTMKLYNRAGYVQSSIFQYGYNLQLGYGYQFNNGAVFDAKASVINDCKGFEVRQNYGRWTLQVIVRQGKLTDSSLNFELAWGSRDTPNQAGTVFATGTMYRY